MNFLCHKWNNKLFFLIYLHRQVGDEMKKRQAQYIPVGSICFMIIAFLICIFITVKVLMEEEHMNENVDQYVLQILKEGQQQLVGSKNSQKDWTHTALAYMEQCIPYANYQKQYGVKEGLYVENQEVPAAFLEDGGQEESIVKQPKQQEKTKETSQKVKSVPVKEVKNLSKQQRAAMFQKYMSYQKVRKNFYSIDSQTYVTGKDLNPKILLKEDLSLKKGDDNHPVILIYHTHASEDFKNSKKNCQEDTVVGVGSELTKLLEQKYGFHVLHDKTVYDVIQGKLDRSKAYNVAALGIEKNLKKYPSIQMIIDLHRDGVAEQTRLVTNINGKRTAQIMFFNGMSRTKQNGEIPYLRNINLKGNLALSMQLKVLAQEQFPGFTRQNFIRGYRYNLHYRKRSMLVEVGAQNNTVEEVKNAMIPFAKLLHQVLR